jgi:hypothetical protein
MWVIARIIVAVGGGLGQIRRGPMTCNDDHRV